jgi:MerR HTH family regulatory protein
MSASGRLRGGTRLIVRRERARAGGSITLDALAREAGVHPDLARRFVALGLLDPIGGGAGGATFPRDAAGRLARVVRLRRDLGLNYAGALLASALLERIELL